MKIPGLNLFTHRRRRPAQTVREARDLIVRFMNDCPSYDFEWDDFISWKNDSQVVEEVRQRLECIEGLLMSTDEANRRQAFSILQKESAHLSALLRE